MSNYPNKDALYKAHDIYRDAMREFIPNTMPEKLIHTALGCKPVGNIKASIDIGNIPHLLRVLWNDGFSELFDHREAMDIRSVVSVIKDGRNKSWAHPGIEDVTSEFTRTHLFLIADVLGEIGKHGAKNEVEDIQGELFSDDLEGQPTQLDQIAAYKKRLETMSIQLATAVSEKAVAEERSSDMSNRLEEVEAENATYKKRIETIQGQLEAANAEKTLKAVSNWSATQKKKSAELDDLLERLKEDVKVKAERQNEKVVAPIPPIEFPYTGSQLRDYRKKAGLTQVAVALALGLSKGTAAAVSDWEVEREKVPPKHYTKLKKLYGLEVLPGNGKTRKKKTSIAERYAAETTEEERNELAVKVAELRINEEGTKPLAWRKIREELGLKEDEFHQVIRPSVGYREAVVNRIKSLKARDKGWKYSGKLDVLTGIEIAESELK